MKSLTLLLFVLVIVLDLSVADVVVHSQIYTEKALEAVSDLQSGVQVGSAKSALQSVEIQALQTVARRVDKDEETSSADDDSDNSLVINIESPYFAVGALIAVLMIGVGVILCCCSGSNSQYSSVINREQRVVPATIWRSTTTPAPPEAYCVENGFEYSSPYYYADYRVGNRKGY